MAIPNYLQRWINIKKVFPLHLFDKSKTEADFTTPGTVSKAKSAVQGIGQMLELCELKTQGSDADAISEISVDLLKKGLHSHAL